MPAGETPFVSLADFLGARLPVLEPGLPDLAAASTIGPASPGLAQAGGGGAPVGPAAPAPIVAASVLPDQAAAIRAARLFRAALTDALDALAASIARELAVEVLGRELRLAAADIEELARRLVAERLAQEPLRLRVAPADAHVACELPVVADPGLQPGDAVLECRNGDIDARLRVRLASVLARVEA